MRKLRTRDTILKVFLTLSQKSLQYEDETFSLLGSMHRASRNISFVNLFPRAIMSFSCRTQPPVMTLVPTYTFVGNLFQAFVMYARVGLRGSRRFGLVWSDRYLLNNI